MADRKKTALAMMGGCETGIRIEQADALCSPVDSAFYRENVREAAALVMACANCQGKPDSIEDPEAYPCPLLDGEATMIIVNSVIHGQEA